MDGVLYYGKGRGFGQQFNPPQPSSYLNVIPPLAGEYQRSKRTIDLINDDINRYFLMNPQQQTQIVFREALRRTRCAFELKEKVKMCHLNDVFKKDLPIWSTSPGLPWTIFGYKTKGDIKRDPNAIERVRKFWHEVKNFEEFEKVPFPDCCAYAKSHFGKCGETKVSVVWGFPATITFGEAVFALPLIQAYKKGNCPIAYELENGGFKKIYQNFQGNHFLSIKFKDFDKTLQACFIQIAFDVMALNINFGEYEDDYANAKSMRHMYNRLRDYFIDTDIRICNGEHYMKMAGLPSGSYFTKLVGSISTYFLLTYAFLKLEAKVLSIKVFGDNAIIGLKKVVYPKDIAIVLESFRIKIDLEKSSSSRRIRDLMSPLRDREKTLASFISPYCPESDWDHPTQGTVYHNANFGVDPVVEEFWCRKVINFRPFDLILSRDQQCCLDLYKNEVFNTDGDLTDLSI